MPRPQEASSPIGFRAWREGLTGLATFPALTVMVFARSKCGFDLLQPGGVIAMTALLLILQSVANFHVAVPMIGRFGAAHPSEALRDFAFAFFFWALPFDILGGFEILLRVPAELPQTINIAAAQARLSSAELLDWLLAATRGVHL